MHSVGRVTEIWCYPVTSIGGVQLREAQFGPDGMAGDRCFGLVDAESGTPAAPEKHQRWHKALFLTASVDDGHAPSISFPDGQVCSVNDPALNRVLSEFFGFSVALATYEAADSSYPYTKHRHQHFPMHLLTTSSINHLAKLRQVDTIDSRRFRPTVLISTLDSFSFIEGQWTGKRLRLGPLNLTASDETKRCAMTFLPQPGLDDDPEILRNILRHNKRHFGTYCEIEGSGKVKVGDELFVTS